MFEGHQQKEYILRRVVESRWLGNKKLKQVWGIWSQPDKILMHFELGETQLLKITRDWHKELKSHSDFRKTSKSNNCPGVETQHLMFSRRAEHSLVFHGQANQGYFRGRWNLVCTSSSPVKTSMTLLHSATIWNNIWVGCKKAFSKHVCHQAFTIHLRIKLLILSASMRFLKVHIV